MVPGAGDHTYTLNDPSAAARLAYRLAEIADGGTVVVGGNGLTGVESATGVAESVPGIHTVLAGGTSRPRK